jgi:transposase
VQNDTLVAVDIAKEVFEVAVSDRPGRVALRKRLLRDRFVAFFAQRPQATVVMEACATAHYWARHLEELGHVVVLLPPQYVRPYVVRNKTDRTDVDGLLEAFRNEQIRPVPIKTVTQQVIATLHRLRSGWLADRVRSINTLRGLLRELGFFIPEGRQHVLPEAWEIIQDHHRGLPEALKPSLAALCEEIASLSTRIEDVEVQLEAVLSLSVCRRVEEGEKEGEAPRDVQYANDLPCQGGEELSPWKRVPSLRRLSKRKFVPISGRCFEVRSA